MNEVNDTILPMPFPGLPPGCRINRHQAETQGDVDHPVHGAKIALNQDEILLLGVRSQPVGNGTEQTGYIRNIWRDLPPQGFQMPRQIDNAVHTEGGMGVLSLAVGEVVVENEE